MGQPYSQSVKKTWAARYFAVGGSLKSLMRERTDCGEGRKGALSPALGAKGSTLDPVTSRRAFGLLAPHSEGLFLCDSNSCLATTEFWGLETRMERTDEQKPPRSSQDDSVSCWNHHSVGS